MGFPRVFCDAVGKRINVGDMFVSCLKCIGFPMNQGGTADSEDVIRPWQNGIFLSRAFLFSNLFDRNKGKK